MYHINKEIPWKTRNKLDISTIFVGTLAGVTCTFNKEKQTITFNGTCTTDNITFSFANTKIEAIKNKTTINLYYVSGEMTPKGLTQVQLGSSNWSNNLIINFTDLNANNKIGLSCMGAS